MQNPLKNPLLTYPLIGAAVMGGTSYLSSKLTLSESDLRYDKDFMRKVRREAAKAGIEPDSKELKKFENAAIKEELKAAPKREALMGALAGGLSGAWVGAAMNKSQGYRRPAGSQSYEQSWHRQGPFGSAGSVSELQKTLDLSGNETTKKQVQKAFYSLAMKHHPDKGGDAETMKKINDAWDKIQKTSWFEKLAFDRAFWLAFEKKANVAAELAGLGTLAVPSIQSLRGKPMKEKHKDMLEVAGLGTLAAPYAWQMGKRILTKHAEGR